MHGLNEIGEWRLDEWPKLSGENQKYGNCVLLSLIKLMEASVNPAAMIMSNTF